MKIYIFIILIYFYSSQLFSNSLFDTDFYEIKFQSNNVDQTKLDKINELQIKSITKIFKKILTKEDFIKEKQNINKDLINSFIKNIIINNEKIINNNYYSKIKVNFNKRNIIDYLRKKNLSYIEFFPNKFLIIIYDKSFIDMSLLSKNNKYYQYLLKNDFNFFNLPNLDLNDRYLINYKDIDNINLNKINVLANKYSSSNIIIVTSKKNNKDKYFYESFLITNNNIIKIKDFSHNKIDYKEFFTFLKEEVENEWKIHNSINNEILNSLICSIQYYNLLEIREIEKNLKKILSIEKIKLLNLSYQKKNYEISYYGNIEILLKLFKMNNLKILNENKLCKISLI